MAGLSVLLEATPTSHHGAKYTATAKQSPQILIKTNVLRARLPSLQYSPQMPAVSSRLPTSSFLESCCLCRKHLSQEKDIYMYRGDRAFCSVECRRKQIVIDEESVRREKCCSAASSSSSPIRSRKGAKSRAAAAVSGGFAY